MNTRGGTFPTREFHWGCETRPLTRARAPCHRIALSQGHAAAAAHMHKLEAARSLQCGVRWASHLWQDEVGRQKRRHLATHLDVVPESSEKVSSSGPAHKGQRRRALLGACPCPRQSPGSTPRDRCFRALRPSPSPRLSPVVTTRGHVSASRRESGWGMGESLAEARRRRLWTVHVGFRRVPEPAGQDFRP